MKKIERQIHSPKVPFSTPATIALCTIDGRIGRQGILLDDFLEKLIQKSRNRVISKREMVSFLNECKIHLPSSFVR